MSPEPQADERTTRCFISFSFKSCRQEQSPKQAEVDRQAGRLTEADVSKKTAGKLWSQRQKKVNNGETEQDGNLTC